jgi:hypothetical protein
MKITVFVIIYFWLTDNNNDTEGLFKMIHIQLTNQWIYVYFQSLNSYIINP